MHTRLAHQLTDTELARRHAGAFAAAFDIICTNPALPSFLREKYQLFYEHLIKRLQVDTAILDYNYTRLNQFIKMFIYERIRVFNLQPYEIQLISEKEYPLALEFYLQFDSKSSFVHLC